MPEWAKDDPHSYWEAAGRARTSQRRLYREIQFALPKELNEDSGGNWLPASRRA